MSDKPAVIRSVDDLTPDDANANKGTERGNGFIEKSLEQCGAGRSIVVDRHGRVIAGNKTLEGWVGLGTQRVRVVQTDGHELVVVQRTDLDLKRDKRARQLAIADNRAGQLNLEWDAETLTAQVAGFEFEPGDIGFTDKELRAMGMDAAAGEGGGGGKEMTCPHCGATFTPGGKER